MKKALSILLCFVLLLGLCACSGKEEPEAPAQDAPAAAPTEAPTDAPAEDGEEILDGGADIEVAPEADAPAEDVPEEPTPDPVEIAKGLIDQPIGDLYAQIGEPESADYAPSCMGDGEDGMLFYDGFIVYTYREGDVETVYDVE